MRRLRSPGAVAGARRRLRRIVAAALTAAFAGVHVACAADAPRRTMGAAVRDSGGVRIVENAAPEWGDDQAWRPADTPSLVLAAAGDGADGRLLNPVTVYRARDGHWVVGDGRTAGGDAVLVYDARGRHVATLGGRGEGPCEFRQLWWAMPYRGDSIAVLDYASHTIAILSRDGACGREVRLPTWAPPAPPNTVGFTHGADGPLADGSFLAHPIAYLDVAGEAGPTWYRHALLRVAPDGESWDSLGLFPVMQAYWTGAEQKRLPYGMVRHTAIDGDGFVTATGESFELRRWGPDGTLRAIVRRAYEPEVVVAADRDVFVRWYTAQIAALPGGGPDVDARTRRELDDMRLPDRKPAISALLVDAEGNVWAEEYRWMHGEGVPPEPQPAHWSVFAPDGRWLGRVRVPGRFLPRDIGDDYIAGLWVDEYDAKQVRVYRLVRPD